MIPRNLSPVRSRIARRTLLAVAAIGVCGAAAAGSTSLASAAGAGAGVTARAAAAAPTVTATVTASGDPATGDAELAADAATCVIDAMPLDVDAINAEQRALADYLAGKGIAYTVETHDGIDWVVPSGTDDATLHAIDDFMWSQHPMPAEVIEQINADTAAMVDYLAGKGITVDVTTDRHGISTPQFDPADPAVAAALDQYFQDKGVDGGIVFATGSVAGDAVPADAVPADTAPTEAVLAEAVPAGAVPTDAVLAEAVLADAVPVGPVSVGEARVGECGSLPPMPGGGTITVAAPAPVPAPEPNTATPAASK